MKLTSLLAVLCLFTLSAPSYALGDRTDYDLDDNGLIEINDLADLNEIRNNLNGKTLYGSSAGCPETGCIGFELTADLDFDTNADGKIDAQDAYWNSGAGWVPIGSTSNALSFAAVFEGNGHVIRNLFINRNSTQYQGLFGRVHNGSIRNIGLTGSLMQVVGGEYSGALAGVASSSEIIGSYSTGHVMNTTGADFIGGLLGILRKSTLESSFSTGLVAASGSDYIGGLVGQAWDNSQLRSVFSTAAVTGSSNVGGLVGDIDGTTSSLTNGFAAGRVTAITAGVGTVNAVVGSQRSKISATYFATDGTQQSAGGGTGSTGATLAQLRCAIAADDTGCLPGTTLFAGWGSLKNTQGEALWDFGDNTQLPGLRLNGVVYRDGDGDGILDPDDAFPTNIAASVDTDGDGYPDAWNASCDSLCQAMSNLALDALPTNAAAHRDDDNDGLPDAWNASCDLACQAASGLTLDLYLNDSDNDGIVNALDEDTVDKDGDGLIEIATLEALNAIRFNLAGTSFKTSATDVGNAMGCPRVSVNGVMTALCKGYELTTDLDFDTNADGKMDAQDAYWNSGAGWVPIGTTSNALAFAAVFEGNGHVIRNLFINRSGSTYQGLFGRVNSASIRNVGLTGPLLQVTGYDYTGGLIGYASASDIVGTYATGRVLSAGSSAYYLGGLVGYLSNSTLEASFTSGQVTASGTSSHSVGGLVGYMAGSSHLRSVFSSADVIGANYVGGLVGRVYDSAAITNGLASGRVTATQAGTSYVGGVVGNASGKLTATYWATDSTQQTVGGGASGSDVTGATLAQLRCAIAADDTGCLPGTTLFAGWGSLKNTQGEALWDFGDNTQLPGLRLNGVVYRDGDGDGIFDPDDAFPFNPAASADSDGDGFPDAWNASCGAVCQANSGLIVDAFPMNAAASIDSDGDGAPDAWNENCDADCQANSGLVLDAFPASAAASLDSDGDGAPDAWNENCDADCQANSGLVLDAFPLNAAASLDSDGDGAPDAWNENCNADCQANSGLVLDAFPMNAAASIDSDGDGAPDSWNIDCETECQLKSGLQIDAHPFDQDNDGVVDSIDPDNTKDNGAPILQTIPDDLVLHATGVSTSVELNTASLLAWDVIDSLSELRFEVSLNGNVLTIDEHSQVSLPSGRHSLHWTAIDSSGNRSESLAQSVVIYPSVGFSQVELVAGEGSVVRVPLVFSGPSPDYPVVVNFQWDELLGEVSLEDFDESMDVEKLQVTISDEDDLAEAALSIVFKDDNLDEANEKLVLSLVSAKVGDDASVELTLGEEASTKTIVVTDTNLAPKVSLKFEHQGKEQVFTSAAVNEIELDLYSGEFQLVAIVEDPNGRDTHRYSWNLGALPYELGESDAHLNLDPIELLEGEYEISLQVTDSGIPNLTSDVVNLKLRIVDKSRSSSSLSSFSSSSSDGSSSDSTSSSNVSSTDSSDVSSSSSSAVSSSASSSQPIVKKKKSGGSSSSGLLLLLALLGTPMVLRKRRRV